MPVWGLPRTTNPRRKSPVLPISHAREGLRRLRCSSALSWPRSFWQFSAGIRRALFGGPHAARPIFSYETSSRRRRRGGAPREPCVRLRRGRRRWLCRRGARSLWRGRYRHRRRRQGVHHQYKPPGHSHLGHGGSLQGGCDGRACSLHQPWVHRHQALLFLSAADAR